jgi:serine/threonine protein kinase
MNKSQMDETEIKECRNEFKILAKLNHPNVIQCYGFYDEKTQFYLAQEYCPGGDLVNSI